MRDERGTVLSDSDGLKKEQSDLQEDIKKAREKLARERENFKEIE